MIVINSLCIRQNIYFYIKTDGARDVIVYIGTSMSSTRLCVARDLPPPPPPERIIKATH